MERARMGVETRRYGRSATLLSAGIGFAGLLTYLFFALASHNLDATSYGEVVVLWSTVFVTISVAHRPIEQLLSRTIAERRARGAEIGSALRAGLALQLGISLGLGVLVLILRDPLQDELLGGEETLYWVLLTAVVSFGASFFLRGFLAGSRRFVTLAVVLVCEAAARSGFALAVAVGITEGQGAVALGVAAAPLVSVALAPALLALRERAPAARDAPDAPVTVAASGGFAAAVLLVMLSEQILLNGGPLLIRALQDAAAAGFIFNVLMVVRAPVLVFQGVAVSLLPHLTRLRAGGSETGDFQASIRVTLRAVTVFAVFTFAILAIAGPSLMEIAFGDRFEYDREALLLVCAGMGAYLAATTLSQAALARGEAARAARAWLLAAVLFLAWCLLPVIGDEALRIELGFAGAAGVLALLLARLHRGAHPAAGISPDSPEEIEARLAAADEAG